MESLSVDIFGNFALCFGNALADALIHQLISLFSVILVVVNGADLRQRLIRLLLSAISDLSQ